MAYYKAGSIYVTENSKVRIGSVGPSKIASFSTSLALPLVSLKASIVATESGSGTKSPTNPYTLGGFSNAVIYQGGGNLFDEVWESGSINGNTGQPVVNASWSRSNKFLAVKGGTTVYLNVQDISSSNACYLFYYDKNQTFISSFSRSNNGIANIPNNACYFKIQYKREIADIENYKVSVNGVSTDTAYHAYNPNSTQTTIALGQTVYGGEIVLTKKESGYAVKLRKTWESVDLGTLDYTENGSGENLYFHTDISNMKPLASWGANLSANCGIYTAVSGNAFINTPTNYTFSGQVNYNRVRIRNQDYANKTDFKNGMNGVLFIYELATPIEIDLTDASDIVALVGTNNVWSDTGDSTVEYKY